MTVDERPPVEGWRRLLVEPRRPAAVRERPDAHWLVVGTVCVGAFLGQLDASIVTVALPTLQTHFHAGLGAVEWVALSYLVVVIGTVTAVGRFADMVGRKLLYTYGFGVFVLGSVACGLAPTLGALVAFRALQAVGAAMLQANSVALVTTAMPAGSLGRGLGVQGAAQAVGLALGPTAGGLLIGWGGWRLVFLVNVPVGVVGLVLGWFLLPRSRDLAPRTRFDLAGLVLFAPAVALVLLGLSFAGSGGSTVAPLVAVGLLLAAVFAVHERRTAHPMVDPALFRRAAFSAGVASGLLAYLVLFGTLFVVPFFLQHARGVGVGTTGLMLTALPVTLGLAAPLAGRAADRLGPRVPTAAGMALVAAVLAVLAATRPGTAGLTVALALVGVGMGAYTPANNAAVMTAAPRRSAGVAGGILNTTRGLGTALGVAVTGVVFAAYAGGPGDVTGTAHAFSAALVLLAALALAAAVLAALRGRP